MMRKYTIDDVKEGRIFVGAKGKRARQVVVVQQGKAYYRSFLLPDGAYKETAMCSSSFMADWAERAITPDEFSRLEIDKAELSEHELASKKQQ